MIDAILNTPEALVGLTGIFISVAVMAIRNFRNRRLKLVTYRVHYDSPIAITPRTDARFGIHVNGSEIPDPSLVLLRVKNAGSSHIVRDDWDENDPLTFSFSGRTVKHVEVAEAEPEGLKNRIEEGITRDETSVTLPKIALNRANRFKLLVWLSNPGQNAPRQVRHSGFIFGGARGNGITRDIRLFTLSVFTGITWGFLLISTTVMGLGFYFGVARTDMPSYCVSGQLDIDGSSAFHPMAVRIRDEYHKNGCTGADVKVFGHGSNYGIRELINAAPKEHPSRMATSDGRAQIEHPHLVAHPIGVIVFSVVVNRESGIDELSTQQLRQIYRGEYTNWSELGGNDLQISIVSRGGESGTRITFEQKVLGGSEGSISSIDCRKKKPNPLTQAIRCERENTEKLLETVSGIPGAIGYAEASAVGRYLNVKRVTLNERYPEFENVESDSYHFWTVEYFYTYDSPAPGSPASAFLQYANSDAAKNILRSGGYTPCDDLEKDLEKKLCPRD